MVKAELQHSGIRKRLIKAMAIFMGIFYLIGPLNKQVYHILHTVSHSFAPPTQIIGHSTHTTTQEKVHVFHDHKMQQAAHEHEVIGFVTDALEAFQNPDQNTETLSPKHSIDKHITNFHYALDHRGNHTTKKVFSTRVEGVLKGYLKLWAEPPII